MIKNITNKQGCLERYDVLKIRNRLDFLGQGLDINHEKILWGVGPFLKEGMTPDDINEAILNVTRGMVKASSPEYDLASGRQLMLMVRKEVFGGAIPSLLEHIQKMIESGWYSDEVLKHYSEGDIEKLGNAINHDRDFDIGIAGAGQYKGKYLVKNRVTEEVFETPQMALMLISMYMMMDRPKSVRINKVIRYYNALSTFKISLPTPIMAGLRTKTKQFSSCVLIEAGDSLNMITAANSSVVKYISQRAGIGLNIGMIRGLGSEIRGGEAFHTGLTPFIKHFQAAIKSCSQGGVRGGAGTLFYPIWHIEFEGLIVLKNNRGVEENRARHLDYGVQINRFFYERVMKGENISLFSPSDVPGLYDAFFANQDKFEELYIQYENDTSIRRKTIKAIDAFVSIASERAGTGRIYVQNVDLCNCYGPFIPEKAPVKQSNLCLEIALPTKPILKHEDDGTGEIALCTLAAFNVGKIDDLSELEELAELLVEGLDYLLDYQDYPVEAGRRGAQYRRPLGVGVINWSYFLAKNGVKISDDSSLKLTHETFEAIQYYLLKASNKLAEEKGACKLFNETKYSEGVLPIDNYKEDLDELGQFELKMDWEALRKDIKQFGLRNSTLTALMPSETSSQVSGATSGIDAPRGPVSIKMSKDGLLPMVVPEWLRLKEQYEFKWEIKDNKPYLRAIGIMQKFVDQAVSTNTNYDPKSYPEEKVPVRLIIQDMMYAYKMGLKTLYYHNTRDGQGDDVEQEENNSCGDSCRL